MAYSDKVLDHYYNPRNVGSFDRADPLVGTGVVGAPECGDVMKLQIRINPLTGLIEDAIKAAIKDYQSKNSGTASVAEHATIGA